MSAGIPYLYCIVHENLDGYEMAQIAAGMNATHAMIPFRTWSDRDEARFLTRWFKEFVRRRLKAEPPQTFEEFTAKAFAEEVVSKWINRYADEFAFMNKERLYTLLYLGYSQCLDCKIKDLELDYARENKMFLPTRSESDNDELVRYAMKRMVAR